MVVGVHTPGFAFERITANVQTAIRRFNIHYPVVQDNSVETWNAYSNRYWPAEYLIDRNGHVVLTHFGEGRYGEMESAIRSLLGAGPPVARDDGADLSRVGSPEMYFGTARVEMLASPEPARAGEATYTAPGTLPPNHFAPVGTWSLSPEHATLARDGGAIQLSFRSGKVFLVASSRAPVTISVAVDGKPQPPVTYKRAVSTPSSTDRLRTARHDDLRSESGL